ncbi:MAG: protein-methionine-sulfoxide reductase heme-binding subunit MsrQ [Rhizobiaceae bacterium]
MSFADSINAPLKRIPVLPLYGVALMPAIWLFYRAFAGALGADPMRVLEHELGLWSLKFMLAALAVTPLRNHAGINLLRFRRMLGLTAFYYAIIHLCVYLLLDRQLAWAEIGADLYKRPYIIFGMSAFILLIPLALTSTNKAISRLGAMTWRKLHRLAYPAAILMIMHYLWLVKSWTAEPLAYAFATAVILGLRLVDFKQKRNSSDKRKPAAMRRPEPS